MPGGTRCSVAICKSHSTAAKAAGEKITFFSFPKDPNIRKQWIQKCYRKHKWNPNNGRICSKHFTMNDFEDVLLAKLMNLTPKRIKKTAVPSLQLLPEKIASAPPKERNCKYIAERDRKDLVRSLLEEENLLEKQIATPEHSTSSENEPGEDCTSLVPLAEIYTFSNHRLPIFKTEPTDLTPESTRTGWQNNARSEDQVPENTSLLNETSEPDEFTHFGNNVADQLRNLPLEKALLCQVEITKVLSKYVVKLENSDSS